MTYGNWTVRHGEWLSETVNIDPHQKVSELSVWFGQTVSAMSIVISNRLNHKPQLTIGPLGTHERGDILAERYGLVGLGKSTVQFKEADELRYISGVTSEDGLIESLQFHSYRSNEVVLHLNSSMMCDTGDVVPLIIYRRPVVANNTQELGEDCYFDDVEYRQAGGPIRHVELVHTR